MNDNGHLIGPFQVHGVDFQQESGEEWIGTCPFCDVDRHFFVNSETGQYNCKRCAAAGNVISFLGEIASRNRERTEKRELEKLAEERGLTMRALRRWRVGWDGEKWTIPCRSEKDTVRDIKIWHPKRRRLMSTKGCKLQLFGLNRLLDRDRNEDGLMWLCEGEWDVIALSEALKLAGRQGDTVLGVPGADVFKKEWVEFFRDKHVRICYDNDEAGDKGSAKVGKILDGVASHVEFLCWPESRPQGWDIRDYVSSALRREIPGKRMLSRLVKLFKDKHRRPDLLEEMPQKSEKGLLKSKHGTVWTTLPRKERPRFEDLVEQLSDWLQMDQEMIECLKVILAVIISEEMQGDPLWIYVVAPPGGGKTVLLSLTRSSDRTIFRSTLTPRCLVSGFQGKGPDPSLLSKVDRKCLVFKDGTELFSMPTPVRAETMSTLRGAYDGSLERSYGNPVVRKYELHFSMLIGMTPLINAFPDSTMGDRFLKFRMRRSKDFSEEDRVRAALEQTAQTEAERRREEEAVELVNRFMSVEVKEFPQCTPEQVEKLVPLCTMIAWLRTIVEKDRYTRELLFKPEVEYGTRLVKQCQKLASSVAAVMREKTVSEESFAIVERCAMDSANHFYIDIVGHLSQKEWQRTSEIQIGTEIPDTTLGRYLSDMRMLGILLRRKYEVRTAKGFPGPKGFEWKLSKKIRSLWLRAKGETDGSSD